MFKNKTLHGFGENSASGIIFGFNGINIVTKHSIQWRNSRIIQSHHYDINLCYLA